MTALQASLEVARRHWILVWGTALLYLVVYLLAIQNLIISSRVLGPAPAFQVVPQWQSRILKPIAAFYYEPVALFRPFEGVNVLLSPLNLGMGLLLGALVGLNVGMALQVYRRARACRRRAFSGLLGALPGFLTGFACCVPTVALVLGAQFTLALIALRSWFFPFALAALVGALVWNARRDAGLAAEQRSTQEGADQERALAAR